MFMGPPRLKTTNAASQRPCYSMTLTFKVHASTEILIKLINFTAHPSANKLHEHTVRNCGHCRVNGLCVNATTFKQAFVENTAKDTRLWISAFTQNVK